MQSFVVHSPAELLASLLIKAEGIPRLLLICGPSGSGKTRWCLDLHDAARLQKVRTAGLISPAVFANGVKTGIDLQDAQSGETRLLAEKGVPSKHWLVLGKWFFDPDVLTWGNAILQSIQETTLLIVDEIGPLEFEMHKGFTTAFALIDSRCYTLACMSIRPSLLSAALAKWPWAVVHTLAVDPEAG